MNRPLPQNIREWAFVGSILLALVAGFRGLQGNDHLEAAALGFGLVAVALALTGRR